MDMDGGRGGDREGPYSIDGSTARVKQLAVNIDLYYLGDAILAVDIGRRGDERGLEQREREREREREKQEKKE